MDWDIIEKDKLQLILIQGLPGSGKSTLAKKLAEQYGFNHFEADQYFEQAGKYIFDSSKLHLAHSVCKNNAFDSLKNKKSCIVSNTFTSDKELRPYYEIAETFGTKPILIRMFSSFGSIHEVPDKTFKRMKKKLYNCSYKPDLIING